MLADSGLEEGCYHSLNWVMSCKAKQKHNGGVKWVSNPCVSMKDISVYHLDVECSYLPRGTCTNYGGSGIIPLSNQTNSGSQHMRACSSKQKGGLYMDP